MNCSMSLYILYMETHKLKLSTANYDPLLLQIIAQHLLVLFFIFSPHSFQT